MFITARSYVVVDGHRRDLTSLCIRHTNKNGLLNDSRAFSNSLGLACFGLAYLPCYQKEENWKLFSRLADHTNSLPVFPGKWGFS